MPGERPAVRAVMVSALVFGLALVVAGCGSNTPSTATAPTTSASASPSNTGAAYQADIKPENFTSSTTIANPYFPLVPGTRYTYEGNGADGPERTVTEVTRDTKTVNGIKTVVVHDSVTRNGKLHEDTYDWYGQDKDGNVWYFGEDTKKLDDKTGRLTDTAGSWEYGKNNAQPGIIMKAKPKVGDTYRQEYRKGEAEDQADVIKTGETATAKTGTYKDVIRTKDYTALDASVVEEKLFAPGIGFIRVEHVKGPPEKIELVKVEKF